MRYAGAGAGAGAPKAVSPKIDETVVKDEQLHRVAVDNDYLE
jgi:hypothetical protein